MIYDTEEQLLVEWADQLSVTGQLLIEREIVSGQW
jgi:hypothetical protein